MPMQTIISTDGRVVLPPDMMQALSLKAGDAVIFEDMGNGRYFLTTQPLRPILDIKALKGCVPYKGPPVSLEAMDAAIAANAGGGA